MKEIYDIMWKELSSDVQAILDREFEPNYDEMTLIKEYCPINRNSVIADIGCGTGKQSNRLYNEYDCKVIAIDPNLELITDVNDNIIKKSGTFEELPIDDDSVDLLFIRESLLHATELNRAFEEFKRVLKKDGQIYLFGAFLSEKVSDDEFNEIAIPLQLKKVNMDFSNLKRLIHEFGFKINTITNRVLISSERTQKETFRLCNMYINRDELLTHIPQDELEVIEATYKYHLWGNLGKIQLKEMIIDRL